MINSGETAIDRIAQAAFHDLAVGEIDGQRRLEPCHAPRRRKIVEWRRRALARLSQQLPRRAHAEAPLHSPAKQQPPADTLTDEDAGERVGQAESTRTTDGERPRRDIT